jgi:hypothetical protein
MGDLAGFTRILSTCCEDFCDWTILKVRHPGASRDDEQKQKH